MADQKEPGNRIRPRLPQRQHSLRARLALGVSFPVLVALVLLSALHYWRELELIDQQTRLTAIQIGEVALGSLRHAMLENDTPHLEQILTDLASKENISRIILVDHEGRVVQDGQTAAAEIQADTKAAGCEECHQYAVPDRPHTAMLLSEPGVLRISSLINNEPPCQDCHLETDGHLGVLLTDVSFVDTRGHLLSDLKLDLFISLGFVLLVAAGTYVLVQRLVIARIEQLRGPMAAIAKGDFSARVPIEGALRDELDMLLVGVNRLSEELELQLQENERQRTLRYQAIVDERERIAREIHDGVAQLMGYVNTKSSAIHLLLQGQKYSEALDQLEQLARSSQDALQELRISILGLRMSDPHEDGFLNSLEGFVDQFRELTGVSVDLSLSPRDRFPSLSPEIELHILRIIQEALINIQKHTNVQQAWVHLSVNTHVLELTIGDDGQGFDKEDPANDGQPHFGLAIMRERAEGIGASFFLDTGAGSGTRVNVSLPLDDR